jgi:hypothetical protein
MMRILSTVLFAAMMASPALATDKADLKLEKAEVKYAKTISKQVNKLVKKWDKKTAKGQDTADIDQELTHFYREELAWLREKGVKTIAIPAEPQRDPRFPLRVLPEPASEMPKMEALRDLLVDLKRGNMRDGRKSKTLAEYGSVLTERFERKNARYKENRKG